MIVYALGGGRGHAVRATNLCERLGGGVVLHQCDDPPAAGGVEAVRLPADADRAWVRAFVRDAARGGRLVVDTFPGGLAHELDDATLAVAARTALVRRFVREDAYPAYRALAARYDERWLPYDAGSSEWDEPADDACVGPIVRGIGRDGDAPLTVIGDAGRLLPGWRALLPAGTRFVSGPFAALPRGPVLGLGAGYNLVWELVSAGFDAAFVPVEKRYDDQHRRAGLLGRSITSRADLVAFLGGRLAAAA